MHVEVELPERDDYPEGEREWSFAGQGTDGYVNLHQGLITFNLAADLGSAEGFSTVAEGTVPADLVVEFVGALLAAHREQEAGG